MKTEKHHDASITLRSPAMNDGSDVYNLVKKSPPLDLNSRYLYLLMCSHFNETCVVAETDNKLAGFITGYIIPGKPEIYFVWQVGVDQDFRRRGIAEMMLKHILSRPALQRVRYIMATVTTSNKASSEFFKKFAGEIGSELSKEPFISMEMFGDDRHEEEISFLIGPFEHSK